MTTTVLANEKLKTPEKNFSPDSLTHSLTAMVTSRGASAEDLIITMHFRKACGYGNSNALLEYVWTSMKFFFKQALRSSCELLRPKI